jgi:AGZA family xanthine/uracil permease-like MFS transporter
LGLIEINVAVADDATLVSLGNVASDPVALLALAGVGVTIFLHAKGITGSIILGILATAAAGWGLTVAGVVGGGVLTPESIPPLQYDITPLVGAFLDGFQSIEPVSFVIVVFTFFFVDFFDTAGTLTGVSQFGDFLDEDGNLPNMERPLMADAIATTFGAMVGTTTVTTYVESSTGVEEGGRTGLTALVVALLFLASLAAVPVVAAIPTYASYLGLVLVGLIMLQGVADIQWDNPDWLIPAGLTVVMMPLTASIANGIAAGIISYPIVKVARGDYRSVHVAQWILAGAFVLYFYVTAGGVMG